MLTKNCNVVSAGQFDEVFRGEALIAELKSPDEETAYEKRDSFLIHLIRREVERHFGPDPERQPFVGDDWWPDHTRHMELIPAHCTSAFLGALRGLLTDEFKDYRVQLCVYGDAMDGKSYIGSLVLYADRVLIESRLHDLLQTISPSAA
jgi:hypothetical protein